MPHPFVTLPRRQEIREDQNQGWDSASDREPSADAPPAMVPAEPAPQAAPEPPRGGSPGATTDDARAST